MANDKGKTYRNVGLADARSKKDMEKIFLSNSADAFVIYQLRNDESTRDRRFESLAGLRETGLTVERACYEAVYTAALPRVYEKGVPSILERLFYRFNMECPEDFCGHSLSVSDVIALKIGGKVSAYYTDRFGFQELHGFMSDIQRPTVSEYLKKAWYRDAQPKTQKRSEREV